MSRHYNTTPESRLKMSLQRKGRRPWNKGLTVDTDERVRKNLEKTRVSLTKSYREGKIKNWNAGTKIDRSKHPNMGHNRKHTPEALAKMSAARKGKSAHWNKGEKSPMWKGGVTPENKRLRGTTEFYSWREAIFTRDNWTCQKYKIRGGKLHPHHILNFSQHHELRYDVNNGITLSEKAHREFHKKYGKNNNTREQILEFINNE
jgi:NUMOD3 motif